MQIAKEDIGILFRFDSHFFAAIRHLRNSGGTLGYRIVVLLNLDRFERIFIARKGMDNHNNPFTKKNANVVAMTTPELLKIVDDIEFIAHSFVIFLNTTRQYGIHLKIKRSMPYVFLACDCNTRLGNICNRREWTRRLQRGCSICFLR